MKHFWKSDTSFEIGPNYCTLKSSMREINFRSFSYIHVPNIRDVLLQPSCTSCHFLLLVSEPFVLFLTYSFVAEHVIFFSSISLQFDRFAPKPVLHIPAICSPIRVRKFSKEVQRQSKLFIFLAAQHWIKCHGKCNKKLCRQPDSLDTALSRVSTITILLGFSVLLPCGLGRGMLKFRLYPY